MAKSRNLSGCQFFHAENLPPDWDCVPLKERLELLYGRALREEDRRPGEVDVFGSNGKVGTHNNQWLEAPGILVGRKGTVGAVHYASRAFWPIDTVYYVKPIAEDRLRYFYYLLNYLPLAFLNAATGVPGLSRRDAYALRGAFPPPNEQTAITRILDAVDTAIERTREAVERAEVLKLALMQAAFSFEMTNEPHKSSDAGHIPESWQAIKGKQAFTVLSGGNSSVFALKPLREEVNADAWFMKVDDFNLPENSRRIVKTQIGFRATDNLDFRLVPIDTLVIAKRGAAILKNRVRTTAVPIALDPNLMGLQLQAEIIPEFFRYQLEWRNLSRYIESSGVPQLNNKDLYPRWFFKPPEDQQKEIVSAIAATETYQDALLRKLNVIEQLKKSVNAHKLRLTV